MSSSSDARTSRRWATAARNTIVALGIGVSLCVGCGGRTPLVPSGPHPAGGPAPLVVQDPPPPTKPEILPLRRNTACFWRGGHWTPRGGGWKWIKGAWVLPPKGCTFAPAVTHFEQVDGTTVLVHRPELWYRAGGKQTCDEPKDCADL